MDGDIMAEFQPLAETRKDILKNAELLNRAIDVWVKHTSDLVDRNCLYWAGGGDSSFLEDPVPFGYHELTQLLTYWCDTTPHCSIDPTPLTDLASWIEHVSLLLKLGATAEDLLEFLADRDQFGVMIDRAFNVINRVRSTAAMPRGSGRPRDADVKTRRADVLERHVKGVKPGAIAGELKASLESTIAGWPM